MENASLLLVDDDPILRAVLAGGLRRLGARVTDVGSVTEADTALAHGVFELIISDVHLDGNEGLRWTEHLLRTPHLPPVLLITGNPEIVTAMRAANLPVAGYLAKPMPFAELSRLVQRLVAAQRQRKALHTLAGEVRDLTGATAGLPAPAAQRLESLAAALEAEAARPVRETGSSDSASRQALQDTIAVLEKTRDSFRSKELGRLRRHLQEVLGKGAAAWAMLGGFASEASSLVSL